MEDGERSSPKGKSEFKCLINFQQLRTTFFWYGYGMRNLGHSFHSQIPPLLRTPVISSLPAKPQTAKMANRLVDDGKRVAGGGRCEVTEGVTAIALHFSSSTFHSFNFTRSPFCFFIFSSLFASPADGTWVFNVR